MARIGVFVCHCGSNIAGVVDIARVVNAARKMPQVVYVSDNKYTCSDPGQGSIKNAILEHKLNRVVVSACSPRMHEKTFRKTVAQAGLNPYLLEIANLREHDSWVHSFDKEAATEKAIELVRLAVAKVSKDTELHARRIGLTKRAFNRGFAVDLEAALENEAFLQEIAGHTDDHLEGVNAFLEKRQPVFKGK